MYLYFLGRTRRSRYRANLVKPSHTISPTIAIEANVIRFGGRPNCH